MISALRSAVQIRLSCSKYSVSETGRAFFGMCKAMELLVVDWGANRDLFDLHQPEVDVFQPLLMNCMPLQEQPLWALRAVIIRSEWAHDVKVALSKRLPALRKLVIFTEGCLDVSFEEPVATSLSLEDFYAFGQPLITDGVDMLRMSCSLVRRGLTVSAERSPEQAPSGEFGEEASCIYLQNVDAAAVPIKRLYDLTKSLAVECHCEACFDCLRRAGEVDF